MPEIGRPPLRRRPPPGRRTVGGHRQQGRVRPGRPPRRRGHDPRARRQRPHRPEACRGQRRLEGDVRGVGVDRHERRLQQQARGRFLFCRVCRAGRRGEAAGVRPGRGLRGRGTGAVTGNRLVNRAHPFPGARARPGDHDRLAGPHVRQRRQPGRIDGRRPDLHRARGLVERHQRGAPPIGLLGIRRGRGGRRRARHAREEDGPPPGRAGPGERSSQSSCLVRHHNYSLNPSTRPPRRRAGRRTPTQDWLWE